MKKQFMLLITLFLLVQLALTGCNSLAHPFKSGDATGTTKTALIQPEQEAPVPASSSPTIDKATLNSLAAIETAFETIYEQVSPAVVNIQVTQKAELPQTSLPGLQDFPFFFGPQTQPEQSQPPQELYRHGAGSGFVWDRQGHIVTNNHVVTQADKIDVVFNDGTTVPATVVGADPDSDLAVLKVDVPADKLIPVQLADSNQVKVGQLAVAIGNPFGLEGTMTVGIVSALGRSLPTTRPAEQGLVQGPTYTIPEVIQTDAPINPGNSGGVLVNDQGQVIGVTAAIESPVRASAGIGFVIPAAIANKVVPALITEGHYDHPWLGVSGTTLNPEMAKAMGLGADQRGALVIDLAPEGPADQAGLRGSERQIKIDDQEVRVGGDVITAIDGQPVTDFEDLVAYLVGSARIDQEVTLTILRQRQEEQIKVTLGARIKSDQAGQTGETTNGQAWLGINGLAITPEIAQAMNLPDNQEGVLIEQVELGSPADQAGLRGSYNPTIISGHRIAVGGDVITAIDGQPLRQMEELQTFIQNAQPGQEVTLTLLRDGQKVDIPLTLSEQPS